MSTTSSPNSKKGDEMPAATPEAADMSKEKAQASPQSTTDDDATKIPDASSPSGEAKSKALPSSADLSPAHLKT
jgi:hypothetical protein